ncbi:MAG: hypothetical protein WDN45_13620 [Caulobacteraceae bacterium]
MQHRLADHGAEDLQLGVPLALEAFHDDQVAERHPPQKLRQGRFGFVTQLVHLHPPDGGRHDHLGRPGATVLVGILARQVDVEVVVGALDGRDLQV